MDKFPKRIREGNVNRSKRASKQCSRCGRYFGSLGEINAHFRAAGHVRNKKPPKKIKFSKDYSDHDIQVMESIFDLLKNPLKIREAVRDALKNSRMKKFEQFF